MKHLYHTCAFLCIATYAIAQTPMKSFVNQPHDNPQPIQLSADLPSMTSGAREAGKFEPKSMHFLTGQCKTVKSLEITESGSYWIDFHENDLWSSRASINHTMASIMPSSVFEKEWSMSWEYVSGLVDERNVEHVRIHQLLAGYPILSQDMVLHIQNGQLRDLNGFAWTGPTPTKISEPLSEEAGMHAARQYLISTGIQFQKKPEFSGLVQSDDMAQLCWFPKSGKLLLAYEITLHPNVMDQWKVYVDAVALDIIDAYSQRCSIYPEQLYQKRLSTPSLSPQTMKVRESVDAPYNVQKALLLDGPTITNDQDLLGQNRTVNGYIVGSTYFMVDASRSGMYNASQSVMPNDPLGVIWTIDGQNGSPQQNGFEVIHVSNSNNNWAPLEVSAHFNAGQSYEYFRQSFNRNSLNGSGGNIISIINVTDENDDAMDNAFWSGTAMFYGNGNVAFKPLAQGLDVAGHEMSHGVIQNTANLQYVGQSGALNESYADVFGTMIDRNDWLIGEDVVKLNVFPSGALRDMSNPHNGGNGPNDNGWQPQHMNEYQNLPNTPAGDNGGVHVNSGIPNRAFFLFATSVGKDNAEQVYHKALRDYLVKSAQFIDMRNAIERAAADLHGANSAEVTAARTAFDAVGIGAGTGDDHQDDIEVNTGDDFILATDGQESDLYWVPPSNPGQFVKLNVPAPLSRPSFTDDGTAAVYVDQENEMILLAFDWSQGLSYDAFYLEQNPQGIWRNVVVSKDGTKIAYTTSQLLNEMWVFDFASGNTNKYIMYNPTSAQGIETGDVLYADAMEWDYTGEYIMYDALNRIESAFGNGIEYWDISFLHVWDNASDNFTDGFVGKLFSSLPENISVGNPSFAKNSPYIITFDFVEDYYDGFGQLQTDYRILAANIESGVVNEIYENTTVGYPSYSRLDHKILFTYDDAGSLLLATIDVQPGDKTLPVDNTDVILITGAQKGVWFQTGTRVFTSVGEIAGDDITLFPQPANDFIHISVDENADLISDYRISDLTGKEVLSGKVRGNTVDVHALPSGMYILHLNGQKSVRAKMVIKL